MSDLTKFISQNRLFWNIKDWLKIIRITDDTRLAIHKTTKKKNQHLK